MVRWMNLVLLLVLVLLAGYRDVSNNTELQGIKSSNKFSFIAAHVFQMFVSNFTICKIIPLFLYIALMNDNKMVTGEASSIKRV